jgi:hypothetical protein
VLLHLLSEFFPILCGSKFPIERKNSLILNHVSIIFVLKQRAKVQVFGVAI